MTSTSLDVVVIGAGVVGLAVARALALAGRGVLVLEAEEAFGRHTSSRNSEVIHAGIYYPEGSLKARACVAGRQAVYAYCEAEQVPFKRVGKLIVATCDEELATLAALEQRAFANGVHDLERLTRAQVSALEPAVKCVGGLLSPSTGIIDSHAFMRALRRDAERAGADILFRSPVLGGRAQSDAFEVHVGGVEAVEVQCRALVNCAGPWAQHVAARFVGIAADSIPPCHYAKGHYFVLRGQSPFSRLVYPVPVAGGLGVHVTLDLDGRARFGPDVSWVDTIDYAFDEARERAFESAIRRYFPALPDSALAPGYTGIRPKLAPEGNASRDFLIQAADQHGIAGLVNLYGIESPGLTAALALADEVRQLLCDRSRAVH